MAGADLKAADSAPDLRWGDLADGTFANPVLNADYSDPDIIRVGDRFYMTCSEFHFMGMPILESTDMVNWRIIGRVYDRIDLPGYSDMSKYAEGTWAPALRYHDGKFYIFVCTPYEGLFMTTATDPAVPGNPCTWSRASRSGKTPALSGMTTARPIWCAAVTVQDLLSSTA